MSDLLSQSPAPIAVSHDQAARMLNVSRAHLFHLRASGKFGPRILRLGKSVRFSSQEIVAWLAAGAPPADRWLVTKPREGGR